MVAMDLRFGLKYCMHDCVSDIAFHLLVGCLGEACPRGRVSSMKPSPNQLRCQPALNQLIVQPSVCFSECQYLDGDSARPRGQVAPMPAASTSSYSLFVVGIGSVCR